MIKTLSKHGNSLALVIDQGVLDLLKVDAETPFEITTDGRNLILSPLTDRKERKRFKAALAAVNRKHGRLLKRLAAPAPSRRQESLRSRPVGRRGSRFPATMGAQSITGSASWPPGSQRRWEFTGQPLQDEDALLPF